MIFRTLALLFFVSAALADLPAGMVTCGENEYSADDITVAINAGVGDEETGNLPGMMVYSNLKSLQL